MLKELVRKNRTYRRFYEEVKVETETLTELVDLARTVPSTANSQALKFMLCNEESMNEKVFPCLIWAGALTDWDGPTEGERPAAYIIVLCDQTLGKNKQIDDGIVSQTIMLGATEKGLGGCIFGSVRREELAKALGIDTTRYTIDLVLALGKPKEEVKIVPVKEDGNTKYYRDENQIHYVPKRSLEDLIVPLKKEEKDVKGQAD
ncbi:MAG: nitroreductase family protein [Lachnospiraceae bacterium]|nr:nitroreductase family protein [Lachnospiraceae bacterium]